MNRAILIPAFLAASSLLGCYNPDKSKLIILCDAARPECPEGQTCIDNRCKVSTPVADGFMAADQSTPVSDGAVGDLLMTSGCANGGGVALGTAAYACPGAFGMNQARQLCAPNWRVCTSATGIDLTKCDMQAAFFIAESPAYYLVMASDEMCGTATVNQQWYGCGGRTSLVTNGLKMCGGFRKMLDCRASGWNCNMKHEIDKTTNTNASDGVLCCR